MFLKIAFFSPEKNAIFSLFLANFAANSKNELTSRRCPPRTKILDPPLLCRKKNF